MVRIRCCLALIAVGTALGTLNYLLYRSVPLRISPETTLITEPVTPDGKQIDYQRYMESLCPPESKTDANGLRLLLKEMNIDTLIGGNADRKLTTTQRANLYKLYNLPPETCGTVTCTPLRKDLLNAVAQGTLKPKQSQDDSPDDTSKRYNLYLRYLTRNTGNFGQWPEELTEFVGQWAKRNTAYFDLVARAIGRDCFVFLPHRLSVGNLDEEYKLSSFMMGNLGFRYRHRIQTGDWEGALADRDLVFRFYNRFQSPIQDCHLSELEPMFANFDLCYTSRPTSDHWRRFYEQQQVKFSCRIRENQLRRRIKLLELIQYLSAPDVKRKKKDARLMGEILPLWYLMPGGIDWNIVAQYITGTSPVKDDWLIVNRFTEETAFQLSLGIPNSNTLPWFSRRLRSQMLGEQFYLQLCSYPSSNIPGMQHMSNIAIAMRRYECDHGVLPPAWTVDSKGHPLHSWRVLLLPYLGHKDLYDRIRLDEPWDSPWNSQFHKTNITCYRDPELSNDEKEAREQFQKINANWSKNRNKPLRPELKDGETSVTVVIGDDLLFTRTGKGKNLSEYVKRDCVESSNPIPRAGILLVAQRATPVCWMKPDQEVSKENAIRGINRIMPGGKVEPNGLSGQYIYSCFAGLAGGGVENIVWFSSGVSSSANSKSLIEARLTGKLQHATEAISP